MLNRAVKAYVRTSQGYLNSGVLGTAFQNGTLDGHTARAPDSDRIYSRPRVGLGPGRAVDEAKAR